VSVLWRVRGKWRILKNGADIFAGVIRKFRRSANAKNAGAGFAGNARSFATESIFALRNAALNYPISLQIKRPSIPLRRRKPRRLHFQD
jgi:hypothetical protein